MSSIEKAINKLATNKDPAAQPDRESGVSYLLDEASGSHGSRSSLPGSRHEHINLEVLAGLGFLTPTNSQNNALAEEFRNIKRPVLNNAFGKPAEIVANGNLVMVTSALPGEGKTFTSINLAMSIAKEMDKTVLLVDADVSMSGVTQRLGIDTGIGLSDVLRDPNIPLNEVLITTNIPKLTILSAGQDRGYMTELLASENMQHLIADIANRYSDRIIIFDSPPLMVTSESKVLANQMGQIVVVIEADNTPQQAVKDALQLLDSSKAIGLVLNKSSSSGTGYGYGYGYGYGKSR